MILKMFVGRVLVKCVELDYTGLLSADEKQEYHEAVAMEMFKKCRHIPAGIKPVFWIEGVESRGNSLTNRDLEHLLPKVVRDIIETKQLT